ncbi:rhodanese-like domain-containing protein [Vreelandella subglaciescola]|uniref:Rhodanese-related sulfurtransferase n=1 Tax=Vreelandella subglaciescola TaxID=29571 RepID=A0A1M7HDK1_9GAMM|nr:rhodanese-like domain-containing protein [Halomonas subglaciescola]SHM26622.1 Rhodanese-related sulfurtransferase [Halomonas subglaciescola]
MIDQLLEFAQNHMLLVGAFAVALLAWLFYETRSAEKHSVSSGEATHLINREDAVVLDIREDKEFKTGHIAGARHIPQSKLDDRMNELDKVKDKPVIIVCKHGQSSGVAQAKLDKAGFERALKLKGGMGQWQADSLPVVKK